MATVQVERRRRGVFGWLIAILFWLFNLLMMLWLWSAVSATSTVYTSASSEAEKAGAAIGTGIGIAMILAVWAFGEVILGAMMFFTRGRRELVTIEKV